MNKYNLKSISISFKPSSEFKSIDYEEKGPYSADFLKDRPFLAIGSEQESSMFMYHNVDEISTIAVELVEEEK